MKKILCAALAATFFSTTLTPVWANPSFSGAEAGSIQIEESGSVYNIYSSNGAIGSFQSFSNAAHETINSIQGAADHTALFRVTGAEPTQIFGALNANSRIFLINPNGIFFAPGSQLNAPGLVASAVPISNSDFSAGHYAFEGPGGYVSNQGSISGSHYVVLIGAAVENQGTIQAPSIGLAAGSGAKLILDARGLVSIDVDKATGGVTGADGNPLRDAIRNSGTLTADGGMVLLTAQAAEGIFDNVINHSGAIRAQSVGVENGLVTLYGGNEGIVRVDGTVDASGKDAGEKGGVVHVLGNKVGLFDSAKIDVSGDAGGGVALIGGDYKGGNAAIANADYTFAAKDAIIDARAIRSGDGGKVIAWADDATRFHGSIDARGGEISGDGGFVETSGKKFLDVADIRVSASAENGLAGTWLLDPQDINIHSGATVAVTESPSGTFSPNAAASTLSAVTISDALNGGTSVIVTTDVPGGGNGDIMVTAPITKTVQNSAGLKLNAVRNIYMTSAITMTGGHLELIAGGSISGSLATDILTNSDVSFTADQVGNAGTMHINFTNGAGVQTFDMYSTASAASQDVSVTVLGDNFEKYVISQLHLDTDMNIDLPNSDAFVSTGGAGVSLNAIVFDSEPIKPDLEYELLVSGNINVGTIDLGTASSLILYASNGDILSNSSVIRAGTVLLTAGGADGDIGVSGTKLNTNTTYLSATATGTGEIGINDTGGSIFTLLQTAGGTIDVTAGGASTVPFASSNGGNITLSATAGDLSIGVVSAGTGNISLIVTTGANHILDANGGLLNISANLATFDTVGGNVGSSSDSIEYQAGTSLNTAPVGGSVYLSEFVPPSSTTSAGGLLLTDNKITGGDNINELTGSLYGEESGGSEEGGEEEEEDKDSTENFSAENVAGEGASVEEAPESDTPAVEEQAFAPCGV